MPSNSSKSVLLVFSINERFWPLNEPNFGLNGFVFWQISWFLVKNVVNRVARNWQNFKNQPTSNFNIWNPSTFTLSNPACRQQKHKLLIIRYLVLRSFHNFHRKCLPFHLSLFHFRRSCINLYWSLFRFFWRLYNSLYNFA